MSKKKPILLQGLEKVKIPRLDKLILGEIQEEKRIRVPSGTKKAVYERAKKHCECCGMPLKMNQGEFHHLKKPTVKAKPKDLQFLCPTHHKLGHERKIKTVRTTFETRRIPSIVRKRVRKHPSSPYWKEKSKATKKKTRTRKKKRGN